jgi:hypothetical protein
MNADNRCEGCGTSIKQYAYSCADCLGVNHPKISYADVLKLPRDTPVGGMAPIGIPWGAVVSKRATGEPYLKPNKGCPSSEFAPTHVRVNGRMHEVES